MAIHTQQSLSGFIATDPQLSFNANGEARLHVRIGQEHFERNPDGSFTQQETTFHDLVMYRRSAERAFAQLAKGDNFVAEGYVHPYSYERDGQTITGEEFVAKRLGHDAARSIYAVDRSRGQGAGIAQNTPDAAAAAKPSRPITL
jgi:single-strand DNA-binding protein